MKVFQVIILIIVFFFLQWVSYAIGYYRGCTEIQQEAVNVGYGYWVDTPCNDDSHIRQEFKWNKND